MRLAKLNPKPSGLTGDGPNSAAAFSVVTVAGIVLAAAVLLVQARALWFTQDDAFISYRYAQNALNGDGLVYNVGERVEGYTNFLWVIWLILAGKLGVSFDAAAKALGLACGAGMIVLTALLVLPAARKLELRHGAWLMAAAALCVGANGALAYWAVSGLETALFGFLVSFSVLLWWRRSRLAAVPITLMILTRPEGGLVWVCLVVAEWYASKDKGAVKWLIGVVALALAPFGVFKLAFYGDLLPNPFHAKTGLSWEYIASGVVYLWEYLRDYGLWGVILIPLVVLLGSKDKRLRAVVGLWFVFAAYVVVVGGDVLRPHRFFVPMLPIFVAGGVVGIASLARRWRASTAAAVTVSLVVLWVVAGWAMSYEGLRSTRRLELALTDKMMHVAKNLRGYEHSTFAVAASTIGRLGYDLPGCRVIDMLGLTDREIARHPETIPGNTSSWRERNYNATYVLAQNPEYIVFSTGYKPSSPAERALLLHSRFRRNYFGFLIYEGDRPMPAFRRKGIDTGPDVVWPDVNFAQAINEAFNSRATQDYPRIAQRFIEAHHSGPRDFGLVLAFASNAVKMQGDLDRAMAYADSAIAIDSFTVDAWQIKISMLEKQGDSASAAIVRDHLERILRSTR